MREISVEVLSDHDPAKSCNEMRARTLSETDLVLQSSVTGADDLLKMGLVNPKGPAMSGIFLGVVDEKAST